MQSVCTNIWRRKKLNRAWGKQNIFFEYRANIQYNKIISTAVTTAATASSELDVQA